MSVSCACHAQSVQDILERASRAMEPPIQYRLSANGKACTVLQKRLEDQSMALRMEFGTPASLLRIETNNGSFEVYPKAKLIIDVGFIETNSLSQIANLAGLMGRSPLNPTAELDVVPESVFEGRLCWKLSQSNPGLSSRLSNSTWLDQDETPTETVAYIDKQTYQLVGSEIYSQAGVQLVQTKISNIEKPSELSDALFVPAADFAMHKPRSIVEYLSVRESLVAAQLLAWMRDDIGVRQLQSQNMLATAQAKAIAAQRSASRLTSYLPILLVCMFAIIIASVIWSQRRMADRWKRMTEDPVAAQAEVAKMMDAAQLSNWTRFKQAPVVLKAFVIYALCAIVVGLMLPFFLPQRTYVSLGAFRLFVPLVLIHTALSRLDWRRRIYGVVALLAFYGAMGIFSYLSFQSLRVRLPSSLQYGAAYIVLEIVLPIAWAFLLLSPSMRRWLRARSSDEVQVHQISMADILYFMLVASLALTASLALFRWMH